jgi:site-specific DNA-adenine methylase
MTPEEQEGGIAIFWNPSTIIMENLFSTKWSIMTHYRAIRSNKEGVITNAYGPQSTQEKEYFLKILCDLSEIVRNR